MMKRLYRYLFARPAFRSFNTSLFELSLSGLGILNYEDKVVSGEAHFIGRILGEKIRKKSPVFFDVGANVGDYSDCLLKQFPHASIYAIEPHPRNFERLSARLAPHPNAQPLNFAVGSSNGTINLYDRADFDGSSHASIFPGVISEIHKQRANVTEVPIRTLDEIAQEKSIEFIDLLKIDTEGNELAVLEGAKSLLEAAKIRFIHFEFNEMNVISRVFLKDFRTLLSGYRFFRLLPQGWIRLEDNVLRTELFAFQNVVAVPVPKGGSKLSLKEGGSK